VEKDSTRKTTSRHKLPVQMTDVIKFSRLPGLNRQRKDLA